jgi:cytochrome c-type biogenesis protein CcmF
VGDPRGFLYRLRAQPRSYFGMFLAHLGVAAFIVGVTMVKSYDVERDVKMEVGDTVSLGPYVFTMKAVRTGPGPNYLYTRVVFDVTRDGRLLRTMEPEKRVYLVQRNPMTWAAIDPGLTRDLYLSLGDPVGPTGWTVRVYYKPFVDWIWGGCLLMALGGVLALMDRRYRRALQRSSSAGTLTTTQTSIALEGGV